MYLQKLTIFNFRSYYGRKDFLFSRHLNLILGSNGDGKTTFFEALNWVLTPDYAIKDDDEKLPEAPSLVSAKMFNELPVGQSDKVLVSVELRNNSGSLRIIERSFSVAKRTDGSMKIEGRAHKAFQQVGVKKKEFSSLKDLFEKENVFPPIIKKYHLFKGEDRLNIFDDKDTLQTLIDMFSEVKDFGPYKDFAAYAHSLLQNEVERLKKKEGQNLAKIANSQKTVVDLSKLLENTERELSQARSKYKEASDNIDAIDSDYDIIKETARKEKKVSSIKQEIVRLEDKIDEKYSFKLLDNQWILMGFAPVLQEFNRKLESVKQSKDNVEADYRRKQEEEYRETNISQAKTELEKIAWSQADIEKMKYMVHTHRCIYCGQEALEGSVAHDFIKQRIEDVIKLLTPKQQEKRPEIKRFFKARNIEALKELGASLAYTGKDIEGIGDEIESLRRNNEERRAEIDRRQQQVEELQKEIETLYASSRTGINLRNYVENISTIKQWHDQKEESALTVDRQLKRITELKGQLQKARADQDKVAKGSVVAPLFRVNDFFRLFGNAIENIEAETYEDLLRRLAKDANLYLARLNVDDFTGTIKIYVDRFGELKIELQDKSGQVITNPNTSLLTTMHISLLLAIAEMTKENRAAEYPLIFDAPTSSFDEGKDKTFYECLNAQVERQCIVVTKSYLYKNDKGEFVVDKKALNRLNCKKYRIRKKTGFDKLDIATIDTEVEEIKED